MIVCYICEHNGHGKGVFHCHARLCLQKLSVNRVSSASLVMGGRNLQFLNICKLSNKNKSVTRTSTTGSAREIGQDDAENKGDSSAAEDPKDPMDPKSTRPRSKQKAEQFAGEPKYAHVYMRDPFQQSSSRHAPRHGAHRPNVSYAHVPGRPGAHEIFQRIMKPCYKVTINFYVYTQIVATSINGSEIAINKIGQQPTLTCAVTTR